MTRRVTFNFHQFGGNRLLNVTVFVTLFWENILDSHHQSAIRQLLDFAESSNLHVEWPKTNGACFTVRSDIELFKVNANGKIGTPFNRWKGRVSPEETEQVVVEFNSALQKGFFSSSGKGGGDIADLMPDDESLARYIDVWKSFLNRQPGTDNKRPTTK